MAKASNGLLEELKGIRILLPEEDAFVPEWNRNITLRAFSVAEASRLNDTPNGKEASNTRILCTQVAHAVGSGAERPLANDEGVDLIESLSQVTVLKLSEVVARLNGVGDDLKNSAATPGVASSSDSQAISSELLPN